MIQSCNKNETYLIDITSNLSQFLLHALYIYIYSELSLRRTLSGPDLMSALESCPP